MFLVVYGKILCIFEGIINLRGRISIGGILHGGMSVLACCANAAKVCTSAAPSVSHVTAHVVSTDISTTLGPSRE